LLITLEHNNKTFNADLSKPLDISIPLKNEASFLLNKEEVRKPSNPNCFNAPIPLFTPLQDGGFIGDTQSGSPVNFFNIQINPHGNGTHTECVGHISKERFFINNCLKQFHSIGQLITVQPEKLNGDFVITKEMIAKKIEPQNLKFDTLLIRTSPNTNEKLTLNYTNTNPTYFTNEAMEYIVSLGVQHLIVDLPSVDKEKDEGKLSAHHIFWN
jgi:arylformamidase